MKKALSCKPVVSMCNVLLARNGFLKTRGLCEVCHHAEQDTLTSLLAVVHVYEADGVLLFAAISCPQRLRWRRRSRA